MSRRLSLHSSALTDDEYTLYTRVLADLALDGGGDPSSNNDTANDHKNSAPAPVGVREVRAWLRGRFSHLDPADIDTILKFFSPTLSASDILSPGQFYAVYRLVLHVESGQLLDRQLAFVQARPSTSSATPRSRSKSPVRTPPSPPPKRTTLPPPQRSQSQRLPSTAHRPPIVHGHTTTNINTNPFAPAASTVSAGTPPVLPPRKLNVLPALSSSSTQHGLPPHLTSTLMKQSLQASKTGQTMKNAEKMLEKERIMQVLKSSSSTSSTSPSSSAPTNSHMPMVRRSTSPAKAPSTSTSSSTSGGRQHDSVAPPLPKRRVQTQGQDVDAMSTRTANSLEQVAVASLHHHSTTPKGPPPRPPTKPTFLSSSNATLTTSPGKQPPPPLPLHPASSSPILSEDEDEALVQAQQQPPPMHPDRLRRSTTATSGRPNYPSGRSVQHSPPPLTHHSGRVMQQQQQQQRHHGRSASVTASPSSSTSFEAVYGPSFDEPPSMVHSEQQQQYTPPSPSTTPRMFRSRSLHVSPSAAAAQGSASTSSPFSSPYRPPPPPPATASPFMNEGGKRRRPETMHYLPGFGSGGTGASPKTAPLFGSGGGLVGLRRVRTRGEVGNEGGGESAGEDDDEEGQGPFSDSHSRSCSGESSERDRGRREDGRSKSSSSSSASASAAAARFTDVAESHIQKTLNKLTLARYKAEAGIMAKRGFVPDAGGGGRDHHHLRQSEEIERDRQEKQGLIGPSVGGGIGRGGAGGSVLVDTVESESEEEDGFVSRRRGAGIERDSMKWPVQPGEGWTALS